MAGEKSREGQRTEKEISRTPKRKTRKRYRAKEAEREAKINKYKRKKREETKESKQPRSSDGARRTSNYTKSRKGGNNSGARNEKTKRKELTVFGVWL